MAPLGRQFDVKAPSAAFKAEWMSPSNYAFTVLLLVGGDVVSRALAQLAGGRITPVAFSFGISTSLTLSTECEQLTERHRLGFLRNLSYKLSHRREQTHARLRHTLHRNQHVQWAITVQRIVGPRSSDARLRVLDGGCCARQSSRTEGG
jgi:hypothetical protein